MPFPVTQGPLWQSNSFLSRSFTPFINVYLRNDPWETQSSEISKSQQEQSVTSGDSDWGGGGGWGHACQIRTDAASWMDGNRSSVWKSRGQIRLELPNYHLSRWKPLKSLCWCLQDAGLKVSAALLKTNRLALRIFSLQIYKRVFFRGLLFFFKFLLGLFSSEWG